MTPPTAPPPAPGAIPTEARSRVTVEQLATLPDSERRTNWINSLVDAEVARQNYAQDRAMAREFALCGQFDDLKGVSTEQAVATAMVKINLGRSWGFNCADSMRNIYFVNGKPALEQDIVASKLQQAGIAWDPEFAYEEVPATKTGRAWRKCVGCTLWLKEWNKIEQRYQPIKDRKGEQVAVSFTLADAENAKYWEKGQEKPLSEKFNYRSYPGDMFYWRCISRVRKYYAPHVLRGGMLREEALEMMPADLPPDQLPRELQPPEVLPAERKTLAERVKANEVGPDVGTQNAMFPE
ncbi:MAG TPA: hypothetical protein VE030_11345 [Burkholderiales bacterium]|nr:hypothetical protein [Burkholderiales bacterium]